MASMKKIRVAVLYGGRSGEHEVSLQSAASVVHHLDRNRYEIIPIAIDKQGRWLLTDFSLIEKAEKSLPVFCDAQQVVLAPYPTSGGATLLPVSKACEPVQVDVIFPVIHGPLCEDGTIQGILELSEVAYVGCGVLSSAVGMDKDVAKRLARDAGVPIVPFVTVYKDAWKRNPKLIREKAERELGYPMFVKPVNMGSSVGVHKVKTASLLDAALDDACKYDTKILIEKAVSAREIEVGVLENPIAGEEPLVSVVGEIAPAHEFYSYEAKYLDQKGAELMIPAHLSPEQMAEAQKIAKNAFMALDCEGLARADMFLDKDTGKLYFNEVNTLPGFTSISMYPKLWGATGIPYSELLDQLIARAIRRQQQKHALSREFVR